MTEYAVDFLARKEREARIEILKRCQHFWWIARGDRASASFPVVDGDNLFSTMNNLLEAGLIVVTMVTRDSVWVRASDSLMAAFQDDFDAGVLPAKPIEEYLP